jgi:hypothetical protein
LQTRAEEGVSSIVIVMGSQGVDGFQKESTIQIESLVAGITSVAEDSLALKIATERKYRGSSKMA